MVADTDKSGNSWLKRIRAQGGWKARILNLVHRQKPVSAVDDEFIVCDNLVKIYKVADLEVMALQGLELTIKRGELTAIIGSSGSGKSTLLNILGGLDNPTAGRASVAGWDLNHMSYRDKVAYKRQVVGFVWQNVARNLISYLTALENVRLPMILGNGKGGVAWAKELLEAVGLGDRMHHRPAEMSGGQQQRVAIAIALANRPDVLLADEPTGSVDSKTGDQILGVFRDVCERYNVTVVVVTHDRGLAKLVDRVVEIRDGKISTESVRRRPVSIPGGKIGLDAALEEDETETHTRYTILDSAGRLQIPSEYLRELGIKDRAALEIEDDHIIIRPPAEN